MTTTERCGHVLFGECPICKEQARPKPQWLRWQRAMMEIPEPKIDEFQRWAAEVLRVDLAAILSSRRGPWAVSNPRHVMVAATRMLFGLTLQQIGWEFGDRDHGTVIHSCKRVRNDPALRAQRDELVAKWRAR